MAGEVKHRDLKDHLPCTYQIQHFFKKKIFLGVKKTPAFSSTVFMAGDHYMEKNLLWSVQMAAVRKWPPVVTQRGSPESWKL